MLAIIGRITQYGDRHRILTVLTDELGKVSVMVRYAAGSKRLTGVLEPFCVLRVAFGRKSGAGELYSLAKAEVIEAYPQILLSLPILNSAGHMTRWLVDEVEAHAPVPELFEALTSYYQELNHLPQSGTEVTSKLHTHQLEWAAHCLALLGTAPMLDVCIRCGRSPGASQASEVNPRLGGLTCRSCGGGSFVLSAAERLRFNQAFGSSWLGSLLPSDVVRFEKLLSAISPRWQKSLESR